MNTYFNVQATIEGTVELLNGSFCKEEMKEELEECKEGWKEEGYKSIKIVTTQTSEEPCKSVYPNLVCISVLKAYIKQENQGSLKDYMEDELVTKLNNNFYLVLCSTMLKEINS